MMDEKTDIEAQDSVQESAEKKDDLPVKPEDNKNKKLNASTISMVVIGALIAIVAIIILIPKSPEKHDEPKSTAKSSTTQSATTGSTAKKYTEEKERKDAVDALSRELAQCAGIDRSRFTEASAKKLDDAVDAAKKIFTPDKAATATASDIRECLSDLKNARAGLEKIFDPDEYEEMPYREVARDPSAYKGKHMKIAGRVVQVLEGGSTVNLRVATKGKYDNVVFVVYSSSLMGGKRVLEDDTVTVYGECVGIHSYKATSGTTISIPGISAEKIDIE